MNSLRHKTLIILLAFIACPGSLLGQYLKAKKLTKSDIEKNVRSRYEFNADYFGEILLLYNDGRFKYSESSCLFSFYSTGRWKMADKILVLDSDIKKGAVPASISYSNDTTDIFESSRFGIVKNRKGEPLTSAFVNINVDSVQCFPAYGSCAGSYKTIDSVRLKFENGFTSKWMKVLNRPEQYILIRVETDLEIESYTSFDNAKFRLVGNDLKLIEENDNRTE